MALLPEPRLKHLDDQTGLTVFQYDKMAPGRQFCDVVVVKASFGLTTEGLDQAPSPGVLCLADTHRLPDAPLGSSLAETTDLILGKPGADIYVTGTARTVRPWKRWLVGVVVTPAARPEDTPLVRYQCAATGPRRWQHSLLKGWHMSEPEWAQAVPVQYELAWGGCRPDPKIPSEEWDSHAANPSGSGFSFAAHSMADTPSAPQWESNSALRAVNFKELVGLGPVARFWESRARYAGTHDAQWREQFDAGQPDFAKDLNLRFFQCAHPALQTAGPLRGNETLLLAGLLPAEEPVRAKLPGCAVLAVIGKEWGAIPLDTVHVDLERNQVHLVWRLTLPQSRNVERVHLSLGRI